MGEYAVPGACVVAVVFKVRVKCQSSIQYTFLFHSEVDNSVDRHFPSTTGPWTIGH